MSIDQDLIATTEKVCPFCGAERMTSDNPSYSLGGDFVCGNYRAKSPNKDDEYHWSRPRACYKRQLAQQADLLSEAVEVINDLTGYSECIYDCSIDPPYDEAKAKAQALLPDLEAAREKVK